MLFSSMLRSSSTGLESLLLFSPGSPRQVAGRLSCPAAPSSSVQSPRTPEPESDIGLQNPSSPNLPTARVTYSDLLASSQHIDWPSTPQLGAGSRVSVGKSTRDMGASNSSRRTAAKNSVYERNHASILQVLSPPVPSTSGLEICPIDIFSQSAGVGLGLGLTAPLSLADVPRSTDELTLIPVVEVAPGSVSNSYSNTSAPSSPQSTASSWDAESSCSPSPVPASLSPSPIMEPSTTTTTTPAGTPARHTRYEDLGHGLPSHMRGTGTRARLPSIPEEDSVAVVSKQPAPAPAASKANAQHAGLGLGLPSALRQALRNQSSPKPTSAESTSPTPVKKWRLQSTVHELFSTRKFAKRPLFPIHEARSREASAETSGGVEEKGAGTGKERASSAATEQERRPSQRLQMSPAMLLAAQSILEEDKKFRRKEGLDKPKTLKRKQGGVPQPTSTSTLMSPTMRLASQVEEQMNQWKLQKQAGSGVQGTKNKKFLF